jgi:hypothetical protein
MLRLVFRRRCLPLIYNRKSFRQSNNFGSGSARTKFVTVNV